MREEIIDNQNLNFMTRICVRKEVLTIKKLCDLTIHAGRNH